MDPVISIKDLLLTQGENFRLSIKNLDLLPRRIYALTGPNGAGKSTLLRVMALLIVPQKGHITCSSAQAESLAQQRQRITLVEQSPYLLAGNVAKNLTFGLKLRNTPQIERQKRVKETLEIVGLKGFEQRKINELSGGEIQRVALARALVLKPQILLLDEPTSNIDSKSLAAFEMLLARLPEYGVTVVLATHDLTQPERLGAEILRIENGRLLDI